MEGIAVDSEWLLHNIERSPVEAKGAPAAVKNLDFGRCAGRDRETVQIVGRQEIVGIEEKRQLAADMRQRCIPCCAFTGIRLTMNPYCTPVSGKNRRMTSTDTIPPIMPAAIISRETGNCRI